MPTKTEMERAAVESNKKRIRNTYREVAGREISDREASNKAQEIARRVDAEKRDGKK